MGVFCFKLGSKEEESFLQMRVCDLPLNIDCSPLTPYIEQLNKELKLKKIPFKPNIWISDDWFSPDGVAGFAVPFYLFHPKLIRLERKYTSRVEGTTSNQLMKLLRHETAHALDNAFRLRLNKRRQKLFGLATSPYPESYIPKDHQNEFVTNLGDHYGQSHPEEDFAETFAFWLNPYSNWEKRYPKSSLAHQKLCLVNTLMSELQNKKVHQTSLTKWDELSTLTLTLEEYYLEKRKRLGKVGAIDLRKDLHNSFPIRVQSKNMINAARVIESNKSLFTKELMKRVKSHHQIKMKDEVDQLLTEVSDYCETKQLSIPHTKQSLKTLSSLFKKHSQNINPDSNRIFM